MGVFPENFDYALLYLVAAVMQSCAKIRDVGEITHSCSILECETAMAATIAEGNEKGYGMTILKI
jgi:hypothetical protein